MMNFFLMELIVKVFEIECNAGMKDTIENIVCEIEKKRCRELYESAIETVQQ